MIISIQTFTFWLNLLNIMYYIVYTFVSKLFIFDKRLSVRQTLWKLNLKEILITTYRNEMLVYYVKSLKFVMLLFYVLKMHKPTSLSEFLYLKCIEFFTTIIKYRCSQDLHWNQTNLSSKPSCCNILKVMFCV